MKSDVLKRWTIADSLETYAVRNWSGGYFSIGENGDLLVHPRGEATQGLDVKDVVDELKRRGIALPLLLRFSDILESRLRLLHDSFGRAIQEYGYKGSYRAVYPIKVNQHRQIVRQLIEVGKQYGYGLEAGSKSELMAVMAMLESEDALIICNGYKDDEYIETALLASKLGRTVIIVVEKLSEICLIRTVSQRVGIRPILGIRVKLSSKGSGRWEASGGDRSKFGLSAREAMLAVQKLREWNMLDCFQLMHFHLGSQISAIRSVKDALREAGRFYVELAKTGANLHFLDVGGGLAVDYDGSQTNFDSSMNYSIQEYANDIVYSMLELCDQEGIAHPTIVTESGRAVVAHHSMIVVDVLGVTEYAGSDIPETVGDDAAQVLRNLFFTFRDINRKNFLESYHDALEYKDECLTLFNLGHLSLDERVLGENLFWGSCQKLLRIVREMDRIPEELDGLEKLLSDTYFCNFSVFQSLPDSWAVDHLFPIAPIHRLNEAPTRRGVLADITCDSDGKIDHFIDLHDVKQVLELHPFKEGEDYYLGIFLVGAYQEILGDLHNLFGNTNTVHLSVDDHGGYRIDHVVTGDKVSDVLQYVAYQREDLINRVRHFAEDAVRAKRMTFEESRYLLERYEKGLAGYTYLEND